MSPTFWLMLMSFAMVAPVMFGLLYLSVTGGLEGTEDARFLPLADPDEDVWDTDGRSSEEGGETP